MSNMNKDFVIYDSMLRQKKQFKPLQPGKISLYVCGMTVYDYCHIGHARVIIFFDFAARFLKALNYDVKYVRNITDIDDKIIKKSISEGVSCDEITAKGGDVVRPAGPMMNSGTVIAFVKDPDGYMIELIERE